MLEDRLDAGGAQAVGERAGLGDDAWRVVVIEAALVGQRAVGPGDVDDRREVDGDARAVQEPPGGAAVGAGGGALGVAAALAAGGPGRRRTSPPSWSTMTSSGASTAAGRLMRCNMAICVRTAATLRTLRENRMTPAASPRAIRRRSAAGGRVPE